MLKVNFCSYFLQIKFEVFQTKYSYRAEKYNMMKVYAINQPTQIHFLARLVLALANSNLLAT